MLVFGIILVIPGLFFLLAPISAIQYVDNRTTTIMKYARSETAGRRYVIQIYRVFGTVLLVLAASIASL